ncbi:hypothetical protein PoB_005255300 [Plakobranchus ocellatus]|uniref:Uncharacterized protein n=1 Tax=Plakobranchus ocellatus TaxID=259542 RepID=A0AAV4C2B0_9GAST|nr:hypothetical protein PoB_005255300 [Plakobranchus ocellatus]
MCQSLNRFGRTIARPYLEVCEDGASLVPLLFPGRSSSLVMEGRRSPEPRVKTIPAQNLARVSLDNVASGVAAVVDDCRW